MAQPSALATVQNFFTAHKEQMAAALPKHLNADRMARLALTALSQNRALAECDAKSIFGAVIVASQLGLEIGVLGQCYLVPYKGKATLIPGWQGLVDLVGRAGRASCWTGAVFHGDEFDWQLGDQPFVKHRPCGESDPTKLTHVYAIGRVNKSEWPVIEVWPINRVWTHRDRYNKVGNQHYSYANPEMYARKVVLLQVLKYLPKSIEISAAMEVSYRADTGQRSSLDAHFQVLDDEENEGASVTDLNAAIGKRPAASIAPIETPAKPKAEAPAPAASSAPTQSESAYADRLIMVQDCEDAGQLTHIASLDVGEFSGNQIALLDAAVAKKRKSFVAGGK